MNSLDNIPDEVLATLLRLGKGDPRVGLIALVNSYESAMESALTHGPEVEPANLEGVPELNTLFESGRNPRDEDGLYNWDYLLATGNSFAIELETGNLPMPEYDRRKAIVRGTLSSIPERDWGSMDTRNMIEGKF